MATQLFFQSTVPDWSRGQGDADQQGTTQNWQQRALATTRGAGVTSATRTSIAGAVTGLTAGTNIEWISNPLDADTTISGTVTFNLWGNQAANANNAGLGCIVQRLDSQGVIVSTIVDNPEIGTELPNSTPALRTETSSPTSTNMLKGDRLRIRVYFNDAVTVTMGAGGTLAFTYAGTTASVSGDSYVTFTENFGFLTTAPSGSTLYLTNTAADIDPNGASYDAKEAWTSPGSSTINSQDTSVLGPITPFLISAEAGANFLEWFTKQLSAFTLSDLVACNVWGREGNAAANAALRCEIAICASDGTSPTVWGAATDGIELAVSGSVNSVHTFSVAGDDTAVTDGQRLRIRVLFDDAPGVAMAAGNSLFTRFNGNSTAADGDTYVMLSQTVTEYAPSGDEDVALTTVASITAVPVLTAAADGNLTTVEVVGTATVHGATVSLAVDADVTPTTVAGLAAIPVISITADADVTTTTIAAIAAVPMIGVEVTTPNADVTPTTVIGIATVEAPAVVGNANAPPNDVAAIAAIPTPSIAQDSVITLTTVVAVSVVPTPTVSGDANLTLTTVVSTTSIPIPTVETATGIDVALTTVQVQAAVPVPTVVGNADIAPTTVSAITAVGAPTIAGNADITPTTVLGSTAVPGGTVAANADITPTTVAGIAAVSTPAITLDANVTTATITAAASVDVPAIQIGGDVSITLVTVTGIAAVPTPTVTANADITPTPVLGTTTVPVPTITGTAEVAPTTVLGVAAVPTATVTATSPNASVSLTTVAAVATIDGVTVATTGSASVTPTTIAAVTAVPGASASTDVDITVGNIQAQASVYSPSTSANAEVALTTIVLQAEIPLPNTFIGSPGEPVDDPNGIWTSPEGALVMSDGEGRAQETVSEGELVLVGTEGKAAWE